MYRFCLRLGEPTLRPGSPTGWKRPRRGDPRGDRLSSTVGPVGEGQWPNARYVRAWEVGRRNSIDEANEQRCSTGNMRPTTGGVRGEKSFGQGELCSDDGDQHTVAGSSLDRSEQSTRNKRSSAFPLRGCCSLLPDSMFLRHYLRPEPSAVVPHAWDLCGGCRVTGIPTVTAVDSYKFTARVKGRLDPHFLHTFY